MLFAYVVFQSSLIAASDFTIAIIIKESFVRTKRYSPMLWTEVEGLEKRAYPPAIDIPKNRRRNARVAPGKLGRGG